MNLVFQKRQFKIRTERQPIAWVEATKTKRTTVNIMLIVMLFLLRSKQLGDARSEFFWFTSHLRSRNSRLPLSYLLIFDNILLTLIYHVYVIRNKHMIKSYFRVKWIAGDIFVVYVRPIAVMLRRQKIEPIWCFEFPVVPFTSTAPESALEPQTDRGNSKDSNRRFHLLKWFDLQPHNHCFEPDKYKRNISLISVNILVIDKTP